MEDSCSPILVYPPPGGVFTGWFGCKPICIVGPCSCQFPGTAAVAMFFVMSTTGGVVLRYDNAVTGYTVDYFSTFVGADQLNYNQLGSFCPEPNFPEFGSDDCPENRSAVMLTGNVSADLRDGGNCAWHDWYTGVPVVQPTPNPPNVWTMFGRWTVAGPLPDWDPPPGYTPTPRANCVGPLFGFLRNKVCLFFNPLGSSKLLVIGPNYFYIHRGVYVIYLREGGLPFSPTGRNVMVKVWERDLAHVNEEYGLYGPDAGTYVDLANYPLSGGGFGDYMGYPFNTTVCPQTMTGAWPDEITLNPGNPDNAWLGAFGPYDRCGPWPPVGCFCGYASGVLAITLNGEDVTLVYDRGAKAWTALWRLDDTHSIRISISCAGNIYFKVYDSDGVVVCKGGPSPLNIDCDSVGTVTFTPDCSGAGIGPIVIEVTWPQPPYTTGFCYQGAFLIETASGQTQQVNIGGPIGLHQVGTSSVWVGSVVIPVGPPVFSGVHYLLIDITFDTVTPSLGVHCTDQTDGSIVQLYSHDGTADGPCMFSFPQINYVPVAGATFDGLPITYLSSIVGCC